MISFFCLKKKRGCLSVSILFLFYAVLKTKFHDEKCIPLALMGTASPDLVKQGFFAVVFVNREYSGQQDTSEAN
ncbi:hypothetical protein C8P67_10876 [Flavobacterium aquicola]|uniref:Uncharacterized protein n=1 Tax=Flavobacterium aquicola TaxID=1682742 RepID=A0A3E0EJJ7_9FLAO|nr:hypothetical protein C8P67_10876 [Flavobacterium aquicola]